MPKTWFIWWDSMVVMTSNVNFDRIPILKLCVSTLCTVSQPLNRKITKIGPASEFTFEIISWKYFMTVSGITSRGQNVPQRLLTRKFLLTYREKRGKEKKRGKWSRKEGKSKKGRWKIENARRKSYKMRRGPFCFSLFKTTEICFGSTKMWIFYREKAFHAGKKSGKMALPPLKNMPLMPLMTVYLSFGTGRLTMWLLDMYW